MTKAEAKRRWKRLFDSFAAPEDEVKGLLADEELWTVLGYDPGPVGFCDCWVDHTSGRELTKTVAPLIVYEMFKAGWSDTAIALALRGIGPAYVTSYRMAQEAGIPPELARLTRNKAPGGWYFFVGPQRRALAESKAMERRGIDAKEYLQAIIENAIDALVGVTR